MNELSRRTLLVSGLAATASASGMAGRADTSEKELTKTGGKPGDGKTGGQTGRIISRVPF
jgi:hypothetical protein